MSQTFYNTGISPYGLTYHGYDQKITLYALADAAGIGLNDLVQVQYDGSLLTASKTLTAEDNYLVWRGAVISFRPEKTARKPADRKVVKGDLLEIQVGGLCIGVKFPTNTVTSAADHILSTAVATPYFASAAESINGFASSKAFAFVVANTSATVKDLRFLGAFLVA